MSILKPKNDYGGHIQTAITQKVLGIFKQKTLHTAYTYVHKRCVKISCNLEMVTRMAVAHFKWNDPYAKYYFGIFFCRLRNKNLIHFYSAWNDTRYKHSYYAVLTGNHMTLNDFWRSFTDTFIKTQIISEYFTTREIAYFRLGRQIDFDLQIAIRSCASLDKCTTVVSRGLLAIAGLLIVYRE